MPCRILSRPIVGILAFAILPLLAYSSPLPDHFMAEPGRNFTIRELGRRSILTESQLLARWDENGGGAKGTKEHKIPESDVVLETSDGEVKVLQFDCSNNYGDKYKYDTQFFLSHI
jgi:hypothetical protein